jgi:gamma-butyrobetaine dioxygenase
MQNNSFITVEGKRFHYIWLRDNCLSLECRDPNSFQKIYDISELTEPPKPLNIEFCDEELIIDWDEDPPHRSVFPISWLMSHAYDDAAGRGSLHNKVALRKQEEILWDSAWIEAHPPEKHDFHSCDREAWVNQLYTLGFAVLKNMPLEELDGFVSSIGPIHYTEGGRFYTVKSKPGANDMSETGYALSAHSDYEIYMYASHLLGFLYFVENEAVGGDSLLVDGFRVAQDFQKHHPDYFQILVETPAQFQQFYTDWQYYHRRSRSIIELDPKGEIAGVYFGHSHACNWDISFDKMEKFYEAYSAFFRYLKSPDYQYCFRLGAGDCLMMQNFRVLHGRTAFDPNSGSRHLEVSYVPWDYLTGRENFRQFKHLYLR